MTLQAIGSPAWRPRFHFTAPTGWLNDPNGLVRVDGRWHLQYQYEWPRCWGHAMSRDLFHWEHRPVALRPDENGDCWSGGTVHDARNTSGLFAGTATGLVSVYTSQDPVAGQRISLASSADGGRTWRKVPGNPILRRAQRDCRDPKVFWDEVRAGWVMVLTEGLHLTFFVSPNLREWRETGRFTPRRDPGVDGFECPDLFPLPVENPPGTMKWVLSVSYLSGDNFAEPHGFGICAQRYYVGEYDGATFTAETGIEPLLPLGQGPDEYAAIVWPRETSGAGRTLLIGWMNHWGYAKQIPTRPWQGCLTLPRELTLHEVAPGDWRIRQMPARELWAQLPVRTEFPRSDRTKDGGLCPLGHLRSGVIRATLRPGENCVVEFVVLASDQHRTVVGYDAARETLSFDRRNSGSPDFHPNFPGRFEARLPLDAAGRLELVIVIDRSTVEVFGGKGEVYLSGLTFPGRASDGIGLQVKVGAIGIERLELLSGGEAESRPTV
jgi:sucrose-6-phosphate hydrolase SacC (GH32 family)